MESPTRVMSARRASYDGALDHKQLLLKVAWRGVRLAQQ
jgi:hypothetical protein